MAIKMIIKATVNQISIVLNFSRSVDFLFAIAEPMVKKTIDININVICIIPKKIMSKSFTDVSEFDQKAFAIGLFV
ncbi:hypothetical protein [Flavobacterium olei]|uniref:hypothetical protein n=1 Tax=Flavobacterium olei TaxID=1886782 RepID=UPI00321A6485